MPVELEIPHGATKEYLLAFGVAAVYVAAPLSGEPAAIGVARDLGRALAKLRERWQPAIFINYAIWTSNHQRAEAIVDEVAAVFGPSLASSTKGVFEVRGERLVGAIDAVIDRNGWTATRHDVALGRVRAAIDHLDTALAQAKAAGGLKFFNTAFKNYRQQAMSRGERFMTYGEAYNRFRRHMVAQIASRPAHGKAAGLEYGDALKVVFRRG
ncbi:hypothetical protein BJ122_102242 [Rhodopseudomonas faecalis]|uniref:Uncharacterized protein n=1 Tax=Rhodopseudomonas faecalis TaxID=99655 RepID=A0A318TJX2_9BRAD|nr:hypothetical protein [Rhodopseudomonas faecalis]PYF05016.1 hypothetical protein BJ122_102242 [Rhodopseudomonas faecalis]